MTMLWGYTTYNKFLFQFRLYTLGPRTTLLLGHQKCSVVQKSAIQGYCYVVLVLYKKIRAMQGQYYIVRVQKTSAMQVKIQYVLK